jgi:potassium efflux system protein
MELYDRPSIRRISATLFLLLVSLFLVVKGIGIADATKELPPKPPVDGAQDIDLSESIEMTLKAEEENLRQLKEQLSQVQSVKETVDKELDAYKLQMWSHSNLFLLPTSQVSELEKAWVDHKAALDSIGERLGKLTEKKAAIDELWRQIEEKYAFNEKELSDIKAERSTDASAKTRLNQFQALIQLISSERKIIDQIRDAYTRRVSQLEQTQKALTALTERFDQEIHNRKKQDLFKRKDRPLAFLGWKPMNEELSRLTKEFFLLGTGDFWLGQTRALWPSGWLSLVTFFLLFGFLYFIFLRLRHFCLLLEQRPVMRSRPWGSLTLKLLQRSLPLLGTAVFLYTYAQVRLVYSSVPLIRVIVYVLLIWLFCRWESDLLKMWHKEDKPQIPKPLILRLRAMIFATRAFAIAYVTVAWMIGDVSAILLLSRVFFEVALLVWSVSFWKAFGREFARSSLRKSRFFSVAAPVLIGLGYTITGGGFLLELAGYGQLALYWYISWGRSVVVVSWASLLFLSLRELNTSLTKSPDSDESGETERARPVKWLLIRLSWLAWLAALLGCLVLAWGGTHTILVGLVRVLSHPIQIGGMSLSLLGFIYALLVLLFTHAATRLWGLFLKKRILSDSGLELGMQESVTTITVYLLWGLGILVSLNAMGLSATSIAVAFGALSIGLGFGLQNIFNNFVSGLILLFERPVQVGDVVQVNEIWGTVTKINVRSTVVQTFDNASLIIPNSDMISNQVTNWSFKDLRLRRIITVGVAYGSPIELVRETLLEIARNHPKVLKRPKPDVLFDDFGDSALIFRLRLWTTIDHFIGVETDVRFEIDRLFRERNIEIAFPQRDIHIRSVVEKTQLEVKSEEKPLNPDAGGSV